MKSNTRNQNQNTAIRGLGAGKARRRVKARERRKVERQVGKEVLQSRDPRWFFDMGETSFGPFSTGGISMGSERPSRSLSNYVGVAPRAVNRQRSVPELTRARNSSSNEIFMARGTDFVTSVSSPVGGATVGDLLYTQLISPSEFMGTRILQYSALFQRYRFKKICFLYEPIANATQSGQVIGYADFDVDNELLENNPDNLRLAAAHQGQQPNQIWQEMEYDMSQSGTFTDLFTEVGGSSSDPRFSIQGVFYLIAASVIAETLPLGNIYIDYEVEFSIPFLEPSKSGLISDSYVAFDTNPDDPPSLDATGQLAFALDDFNILVESGPQGKVGPGAIDLAAGLISIPIPLYAGQTIVANLLFDIPLMATPTSDATAAITLSPSVINGGVVETVSQVTTQAILDTTKTIPYGAAAQVVVEVKEYCDQGLNFIPLLVNWDEVGETPVRMSINLAFSSPTSMSDRSKMLTGLRLAKKDSKLLERLAPRLRSKDKVAHLRSEALQKFRRDCVPKGNCSSDSGEKDKDKEA